MSVSSSLVECHNCHCLIITVFISHHSSLFSHHITHHSSLITSYHSSHHITSHHSSLITSYHSSHHTTSHHSSHHITHHSSHHSSHHHSSHQFTTHLIISIQIRHLDLQPEQPALAQRFLPGEAQQPTTQIIAHVVQMRRNGVHTPAEVKVHRKEHNLPLTSPLSAHIVLELARDVQLVAQITA